MDNSSPLTRTQELDPNHEERKGAQRAIRSPEQEAILQFGTSYTSYDREVFVLTDRQCVRFGLDASRYRGMAVVTDGERIVTVLHKFSIAHRPGVASRRARRERELQRRLRPTMQKIRAGRFDPDFDLD